jgi:hypothetical protein
MTIEISPLLRYLLSAPQTGMNKVEVSDTGVGMQSNNQRRAAGNKFMTKLERERVKEAKTKKSKKPKKDKDKLKVDRPVVPEPPVQLPEPPLEEELGLIGNM